MRKRDARVAEGRRAIAAAERPADVGPVVARALHNLVEGSDVVVFRLEDRGRFAVTGTTVEGTEGMSGDIGSQPLFAAVLTGSAVAVVPDPDDPRAAGLSAAGVRRADCFPLADAGRLLGGVVVLQRHRTSRNTRAAAQTLVELAGSVLGRLEAAGRLAEHAERMRQEEQLAESLIAVLEALDEARRAEDIIGVVLKGLGRLDASLLGAVAGDVTEGVVGNVAARGTTPRDAVRALPGTRLDGFPIGRQLLAGPEPAFADVARASHATRTRIMQPIGARSILAAAGRDRGEPKLVVSAYRSSSDPPSDVVMTAIEVMLDHAAQTLARLGESGVVQGFAVIGRTGAIRYRSPATPDFTVDERIIEALSGKTARPASGPTALGLGFGGAVVHVAENPAAGGAADGVIASQPGKPNKQLTVP